MAARAYSATQVAEAYVSFLRRSETPEWTELRETAQPYRRRHLAASWSAGWLAHGVQLRLGEGLTNPQLSKACRAAWLRGYQAREALAHAINPQEDQ